MTADDNDPTAPNEAEGQDPGDSDETRKEPVRASRQASTPQEIHDRLALFGVRALFFFIAGAFGFAAVNLLGELTDRPDLVPPMGMLVACGAALVIIFLESRLSRSPIRTISSITFGLLLGLTLSLVFHSLVKYVVETVSPLEIVVHERFQDLLLLLQFLSTTLFCYFSVTLLLQTKDDFRFIIPYVEFRRELKGATPLLVDTSCFVDGRIKGILATHILDNRLVVPTFVLDELQGLADSSKRSTRERGRRGLDILREMERQYGVELINYEVDPATEVDAALLTIAGREHARLITTDYNLQKNGTVQGLTVINVNDLATALKPNYVPGESLRVRLLREGEEKGQAVGFLEDGTMVVVEEARQHISEEVFVEVTSSLQTHAGKMVFGRLSRSAKT